jgi:hypothetical protein
MLVHRGDIHRHQFGLGRIAGAQQSDRGNVHDGVGGIGLSTAQIPFWDLEQLVANEGNALNRVHPFHPDDGIAIGIGHGILELLPLPREFDGSDLAVMFQNAVEKQVGEDRIVGHETMLPGVLAEKRLFKHGRREIGETPRIAKDFAYALVVHTFHRCAESVADGAAEQTAEHTTFNGNTLPIFHIA